MKLKRGRRDWPSEWRKPVEQRPIPVGEALTEGLHPAAAGEAKKSGRQPSSDASEERGAAADFSQEVMGWV